MANIRFNDALRLAASAASNKALPADWPVRLVRDVYGRLRFAIDCDMAQYPEAARLMLETAQRSLGAYATSN